MTEYFSRLTTSLFDRILLLVTVATTGILAPNSALAACNTCGAQPKVKFGGSASWVSGPANQGTVVVTITDPSNGAVTGRTSNASTGPPSGTWGKAWTKPGEAIPFKPGVLYSVTIYVNMGAPLSSAPPCSNPFGKINFELADACGLEVQILDPGVGWKRISEGTILYSNFQNTGPTSGRWGTKVRLMAKPQAVAPNAVSERTNLAFPSIPQDQLTSSSPTIAPASFGSTVNVEGLDTKGSRVVAGFMELAGTISPTTASISNLKVQNPAEVNSASFDVVMDGGNLSQVKTEANLLSAEAVTGGGISVKFYNSNQFNPVPNTFSRYDVNSGEVSNPAKVVTYTPIVAGGDHLGGIRITTVAENGKTHVRDLLSTSGDGLSWRVIEDGLETTEYASAHANGVGGKTRTDSVTVTRDGQLFSKTMRNYRYLTTVDPVSGTVTDSSLFLEQEAVYDTASTALITTYTPASPPLSLVGTVQYPDGSWEAYRYYDGNEPGCETSWVGLLKETLRPVAGSSATAATATATNSESEITAYSIPTETSDTGPEVVSEITTRPGVGTVKKKVYSPSTGPSWTLMYLLSEAGMDGDWNAVVNPSEHLKGNYTDEYASENEMLSTLSLTYRTSGSPGSPWDGRSFASLDSKGDGTVTGYERGSFTALTGAFVPDADPSSATGGYVRATTLAISGGYSIPEIFEATKTIEIEDLTGRLHRKELWVRDSEFTWALATVNTYEYTVWGDGSLRTVTERKDGRITFQSENYSPWEESTWNEQGIETHVVRDTLGRTVTSTIVGVAGGSSFDPQPDIVTTYLYNGRTTTETVSAGTLARTQTSVDDLAGRRISETAESGAISLTGYLNGGRDTSTTLPGGLIRLETRNIEGQVVSVSGSAVVDTTFETAYSPTGNSMVTVRVGDLTNSPRYTSTEYDWANRVLTVTSPSPTGTGTVTTSSTYVSYTDELASVSSAQGTKLFVDSDDGPGSSRKLSGFDRAVGSGTPNGYLELASSDEVVESKTSYALEGGVWWEVSVEKQYDTTNNSVSALTTVTKSCVHGNAGGFASRGITISPSGATTTVARTIDRSNKTVTETETRNASSSNAVSININGLLVSETSYDTVKPTRWNYNGLGQVVRETSPRGAITRKEYYDDGDLAAEVDHSGKTTSYEYYGVAHLSAGMLRQITDPDGKTTTFVYSPIGLLTERAGTAAHKVSYEYDPYGAKKKMTTWGDGATGDMTEWFYQDGTGLLTSKADAASEHSDFTYDSAGRLYVHTLARGVTVTYSYNSQGFAEVINYSDSTPDVTFSGWDRLGRPTTVTQAGIGSETLSYHAGKGGVKSRYFASGHPLLPGIGITNTVSDLAGRPKGVVETSGAGAGTAVRTISYGYDPVTGQFSSVTDGIQDHVYSYHSNSSLVSTVLNRTSGSAWFRESRYYDTPGRLTGIRTDRMSGTSVLAKISSNAYDYDELNRRVKDTFNDGSTWEYGYNARSEITSATRKTASGQEISPMAAVYSYDGIGNRLTSESGVLGNHGYTSNPLNQYYSVTTSGNRTAIGRADASWSILVSGGATTRAGEIYYRPLTASNGSAPVWQDVVTMRSTGSPTTTKKFWYAKTPTALTYDEDGNLLNDGRWAYTWDAENRLIQMETTPEAIAATHPYTKLKFVYDYQGRRIARTVYRGGSAATPTFLSSRRWLYDGWNIIAEFSAPSEASSSLTRINTFTWGLDSSGSLQGAGGVGGLLVQTTISGAVIERASYDGNGNIVAWTKSTQSAPTSRREYDSFGNTLVSEGTSPSAFGFSTKIQDPETGLYYYGYRFYDPVHGRWVSRDPLAEKHEGSNYLIGEVDETDKLECESNIYSFVSNSPRDHYDMLGLFLGASGDVETILKDSTLPAKVITYLKGLKIKGHMEMKNHNAKGCAAFDYREADDNAKYNAKKNPDYHFREPAASTKALDADILKADSTQFELDMHAMQDYYVHKPYMKQKEHQTAPAQKRDNNNNYEKFAGYTINPDFKPKGTEIMTLWDQANKETEKWVKKWEEKNCCIKGKWQKL